MSLRILSVGYPLAPVSLDSTGGAEQILAILDEGLVSLGHRSIVIASEGSRVRGELIPMPRATPPFDYAMRNRMHGLYREAIEKATVAHRPDILHLHGLDALSYLPPSGPPALVTLHLPPSFYPEGALGAIERPHTFLNCVSDSQSGQFPNWPHRLDVVPNGIRLDDYAPSEPRDFALAIGRICPEKGYHDGLDAAKLADIDMRLVGLVFPYEDHDRYFRREIAERLDERRRYCGPVGLSQKRKLLAEARCVVIPSLVPETSSLVAMEALASGTPVVARRIGALPEVITDGETGFLVESAHEMAQAMKDVGKLDRSRCRKVAETRFSAERMIATYIERYQAMQRARGAR